MGAILPEDQSGRLGAFLLDAQTPRLAREIRKKAALLESTRALTGGALAIVALKVDAVDPVPSEAELRRQRRKLQLLVGPLVLLFALRGIGIALAPALLERAPVALFLMAPLGRHLVLISPVLDSATFVILGMVGYFTMDPFTYMLGREYGQDAVSWIERRSGIASRWVRWIDRMFRRAAPVVLFVSPGPFVNLLAGAAKMRVAPWLALNLSGTLVAVMIARYFSEALAGAITAVREFVEANVAALTLISIAVVVLSTVLRRRRARRMANEPERVSVVTPSQSG
jgi:membrane protein DedA with SNARE-associated domain